MKAPRQWEGLIACALLSAATLASADNARVWPPELSLDHTLVQTSLVTQHFSSDPEHTEDQRLLSIELHNPERWLVGAAWFRNSFDQPSWYWYAGREFPFWRPSGDITFRAKLTAGLLRGYDGDYRDKIPFNHLGVAPAALPSVGVRWGRMESDLIVFGTAGAMITVGLRF
ncbi:hypothetical protein [Halomonas urumqiensis]|uniref:Sn-glycerol-3-phosphate transporter n=1 Tax=Halomonas urumqiensis TaxID=1684789 RepID=A0A2N7ULA9_9GAMM|nr:hypothetical protein [Halomonas urumqiensis]PMR81214.1 hypothetical protein C1H70_05715 [Halomonas urumqiensis]PTB01775.1 hypothetical protein C6V82_13995 [Halomonas urumqiensis]GHE22120.1 hypothetical protein GCM10017767_26410 [Halomonas urumqiensis]